MFFTKLILHKCNRFYVKGIETLEINPSTKTQIILGTNGSGKSSLLKVGFTVMPGERRDFEEGGYKELHVLHRGNSYVLRTDVPGRTVTHSFVCNDEELNEGKTAAVQRELVKEHFGMTQELHRVLTGQLKFTNMNPTQRREWITLLSSADFDYVIRLHGQIKRAARDKGVLIKHLAERIVTETSKRVDEASMNALRRQSQEITERLVSLHQNSRREGLADNFDVYAREYHDLMSDVDGLLQRARYLKVPVPKVIDSVDMDDVLKLRDNSRSRVQMLEAALQEVSDRHQAIDKQLHDVRQLEETNPEELHRRLEELSSQRDQLAYRTQANPERLPLSTLSIPAIDEVTSHLHGLDIGDDALIDRTLIQKKQGELSELQGKLLKGTSRISELEYRLNHIRNCTATVCPKCTHTWKEGVGGDEETQIKALLEKGQAFKKRMESQIEQVRDWLGQARVVDDALHELHVLRERHPELSELWSLVHEAGGFAKGRELIAMCNAFKSDVQTKMRADRLLQEMMPIQERLQALKELDGSSGLREVARQLSERVVDLKASLLDAREVLKTVDAFYSRLIEAQEIGNAVESAAGRMDDLMTQMCRFMAVEEIASQIKHHQATLGRLENSLSEAEMQMGIIRDLNQSLEQASKDSVALTLLEKILSPKDGLIAEQILVFINTFIASINEVIAKVWGYNLALDNCNLEDGELDYKFPMYIHSTDNSVPDIEFGSDSQVDIVNQAFRLIVYLFLDLQDYPLYLDELGRTFDEVHRLNLTLTLKELIDDERYSQVFIISHYIEGQGSFPNSQIAVIDDSHISLKREYNEHVTIV